MPERKCLVNVHFPPVLLTILRNFLYITVRVPEKTDNTQIRIIQGRMKTLYKSGGRRHKGGVTAEALPLLGL